MPKITIVSRGDQALLIDISGCATFKEAIEQLSSTFLNTNQFWQDQIVDLNLGYLLLSRPQAAQIIALANGVGAHPKHIFARNAQTVAALQELEIAVTTGQPTPVSAISLLPAENLSATEKSSQQANVEQEEKVEEQGKPEKNEGPPPIDTTLERIIMFEGEAQTNQEEGNELSGEQQADESADDTTSKTELETKEEVAICYLDNKPALSSGKNPALFLKQTLRAGQAISHNGDLIIIGDVNAGAEIVAEGDITVWGSLRGIAHAGIGGNTKAEIRALRFQPIQIRIANYIARCPDQPVVPGTIAQTFGNKAETAKLMNGKIRILHNTLE